MLFEHDYILVVGNPKGLTNKKAGWWFRSLFLLTQPGAYPGVVALRP